MPRNFANSRCAPYVSMPMTCSIWHVGAKIRDTRWASSTNPFCSSMSVTTQATALTHSAYHQSPLVRVALPVSLAVRAALVGASAAAGPVADRVARRGGVFRPREFSPTIGYDGECSKRPGRHRGSPSYDTELLVDSSHGKDL